MTRIAVFGLASAEKEALVSKLNIASKEHSFVSSTPNDRFTHFNTGETIPIYSAPWQLLLVDLADTRLDKKDSIEDLFPQCNFNRPLIIIFHGDSDQKAGFIQKQIDKDKPVSSFYIQKLEEITHCFLLDTFGKLENKKNQVNSLPCQ